MNVYPTANALLMGAHDGRFLPLAVDENGIVQTGSDTPVGGHGLIYPTENALMMGIYDGRFVPVSVDANGNLIIDGGGDADTLNGHDSAYFAVAGHSHPAGDATTLDGLDSTAFLKVDGSVVGATGQAQEFTTSVHVGNGGYFSFPFINGLMVVDDLSTPSLTPSVPNFSGLWFSGSLNPASITAASPSFYGVVADINIPYDNDDNWYSMNQFSGYVDFTGSGTLSIGAGYTGQVYNGGDGTITNAYGLYPYLENYGGGHITNMYGVYAELQGGGSGCQNKYAIYALDVSGASTGNYSLYTNAGDVRLMESVNDKIGFHGATPVAKQTVTGSRGGNAALADLLTKLANLGLIVNSTS